MDQGVQVGMGLTGVLSVMAVDGTVYIVVKWSIFEERYPVLELVVSLQANVTPSRLTRWFPLMVQCIHVMSCCTNTCPRIASRFAAGTGDTAERCLDLATVSWYALYRYSCRW